MSIESRIYLLSNERSLPRASFTQGVLLSLLAAVGSLACGSQVSPDGEETSGPKLRPEVLGRNFLTGSIPTLTPISKLAPAPTSQALAKAPMERVAQIQRFSADQLRSANINPAQPSAYVSYGIEGCNVPKMSKALPDLPLSNALSRFLGWFRAQLAPGIAEASPLGAPETSDDFLNCIRRVEEKYRFFAASGKNVESWSKGNILGLETIASWRNNLAEKLKDRGFAVDQIQVDNFFGRNIQILFRKPDGSLGQFSALFLDNEAEVVARRRGGAMNVFWSGDRVWIVLDNNTLMAVSQACVNPFIGEMQITPLEIQTPTPTATPEVTLTPTATSTVTSTATITTTPTVTPTWPGIIRFTPTKTPEVTLTPTATSTSTSTSTSTVTPTTTFPPPHRRRRGGPQPAEIPPTATASPTERPTITPQPAIPTATASPTPRPTIGPQPPISTIAPGG